MLVFVSVVFHDVGFQYLPICLLRKRCDGYYKTYGMFLTYLIIEVTQLVIQPSELSLKTHI